MWSQQRKRILSGYYCFPMCYSLCATLRGRGCCMDLTRHASLCHSLGWQRIRRGCQLRRLCSGVACNHLKETGDSSREEQGLQAWSCLEVRLCLTFPALLHTHGHSSPY